MTTAPQGPAPSRRLLSVGALTHLGLLSLGAGVLYVAARNLPDEACQAFHYEAVVPEEGGEPEFCGLDEARYLDLDRLRYAVTSRLESPVHPGGEYKLHLSAPDGSPLRESDLGLTHTRRIHLLLIDPSLADYHHIHPVEVSPGQFAFHFEPRQGGDYHLFAEFVPKETQRRVVLKETIAAPAAAAAPVPPQGLTTVAGPYEFELVPVEGDLRLWQDNDLSLRIRSRETGQPVELETVMGAFAHLVAFDENRRGFAHMHPLDDGTGVGSDEARFGFAFKTDRPGRYRVWAQIQVDGQDLFAPFDLHVEG